VASAQCTGQFPGKTVCANTGASTALPAPSTSLPAGTTIPSPSVSPCDNSLKIPTTAWVIICGGGGGGGAVSSVFGRAGAVVAATGDYTFSQIGSTPTTVSGYGITNALVTTNNLSDLTSASSARSNLGLGTLAVANATAPPALGGVTPNSAVFTTLTTNGTTNIITGPFQFNGNPMALPSIPATLAYQAGAWTVGDCLQVGVGAAGAISDAGAPCGSGGSGGGSVAHTQDFLSGSGFTPGLTTALTLSSIPQAAASLVVTFDGVTQAHDTWSLNLTNGVVSFNAAIPTGVQVVEAQWLTTAVGVITALTGDVTASGSGSVAATIAANAVTYAKFQQVAASSLVGNPTGALANAEGITLGATLGFSGTTLNCTTATTSLLGCVKPDGSTITISGGVITAAGAVATTIDAGGATSITNGTNSDCLYDNNGKVGVQSCGSATSVTVGSTTIASGTNGYILYNNSGVLGNEQNLTFAQMAKFSQVMAVLKAAQLAGPLGFILGAL